jgi:hypothetical protein
MGTVKIKKGLQVGVDDLVQSISRLNNTELTTFFERLNYLLISQKTPSKLGQEAILLQQIRAMIPASVIRRFKHLQTKQHNYSISEKEQEEILIITDFIEQKSAERITLLASLAKIRQISLTELAQQLQLKNYHA